MSLLHFLNLLYYFKLRRSGEDKLYCASSKRGLFDVRSFYFFVSHVCTLFPWKCIWQNKVLMRDFFAWSAALGKILTIDNIRKWHAIVLD